MANQNQGLPVNDQTQAVLSKYGITAPRKITNIQNIQNKTETDIKIVQPDIRVSAPNIQVNPVEIAVQRYRSWVESAYGKQKELADKQKADLREKEYSLGKNVNKIFRKIEDLSSAIVDKARNFNLQIFCEEFSKNLSEPFSLRFRGVFLSQSGCKGSDFF